MADKELQAHVPLIVAGAFFMQNLDSAILNTSLPQMAASFGVPALHLSAGITSYVLATAACLPASGWIADRYGARRVFVLSIVLFTLASIACGAAPGFASFILARVAQGAAAALMAPVGRNVVLRNTPPEQLVNAVATITWPALLAPVIAPVLGGYLTTYASWRWNFLLNAPLGVIAVFLVLRSIPELPPEPRRAFDWVGMLLSAAGLSGMLYSLESLASPANWLHGLWVLTVLAVVCLIACGRHLARSAAPLVDLAPLRAATFFSSTAGAGLWFRCTIAATPFLLPLLFQVGFGDSALHAGQLIMIYFLGNVGMKPFTTRTLRRFGFRSLLIANGTLSGLSILAMGFITPRTPWLPLYGLLFLAGLARSMQFTCLNTLGFADVPKAQSSSASALFSMLQQIALALGVALAASLLRVQPLLRGAGGTAQSDFRLAFVAMGVLGIASSWYFARLPRDAGAIVSGHTAGPAAPRGG
ncbi:MAG TPA: MFS transporter [Steroidobacteraceae bacterium]|nr:MFS transporter [Steroidobacteraceae bacterium]